MLDSRIASLLASLFLAGCIVVPRTTDSFDPDCRVDTHHMELTILQMDKLKGCETINCQLGFVAAVGATAVSTIVSGSIVLVGNVVYWSEHRISCPPATTAARPASAAA